MFHETMLSSILKSKMQFFESTPIGRIINRFSHDLNSIEFNLPESFKDFIYSFFEVLTIIVMISVATPYFLIAVVALALVYIIVQV